MSMRLSLFSDSEPVGDASLLTVVRILSFLVGVVRTESFLRNAAFLVDKAKNSRLIKLPIKLGTRANGCYLFFRLLVGWGCGLSGRVGSVWLNKEAKSKEPAMSSVCVDESVVLVAVVCVIESACSCESSKIKRRLGKFIQIYPKIIDEWIFWLFTVVGQVFFEIFSVDFCWELNAPADVNVAFFQVFAFIDKWIVSIEQLLIL